MAERLAVVFLACHADDAGLDDGLLEDPAAPPPVPAPAGTGG